VGPDHGGRSGAGADRRIDDLTSQGPIAGTGAAIEIVDLGTTSWISPTDFLLELPSQELLEEVPTFGRTGDLIGEDRERPFDDPIERRNRT
jgi:hypothetical protein